MLTPLEILVMLPSFVLPIAVVALAVYLVASHRALVRRVRELEGAVAELTRRG